MKMHHIQSHFSKIVKYEQSIYLIVFKILDFNILSLFLQIDKMCFLSLKI